LIFQIHSRFGRWPKGRAVFARRAPLKNRKCRNGTLEKYPPKVGFRRPRAAPASAVPQWGPREKPWEMTTCGVQSPTPRAYQAAGFSMPNDRINDRIQFSAEIGLKPGATARFCSPAKITAPKRVAGERPNRAGPFSAPPEKVLFRKCPISGVPAAPPGLRRIAASRFCLFSKFIAVLGGTKNPLKYKFFQKNPRFARAVPPPRAKRGWLCEAPAGG